MLKILEEGWDFFSLKVLGRRRDSGPGTSLKLPNLSISNSNNRPHGLYTRFEVELDEGAEIIISDDSLENIINRDESGQIRVEKTYSVSSSSRTGAEEFGG